MPSMPIYFWNDPKGQHMHDAYFDTYPGIWRHGDWVTETSRGTFIVQGRSDATLNRQGVRLGTADIYAALEEMPEIQQSLVLGIEFSDGQYRSEEHTSELQSRGQIVCRLLLEKKTTRQ